MSKFDPKSPKGSVPNCQSKFPTRDAKNQEMKKMVLIRWISVCILHFDFKCRHTEKVHFLFNRFLTNTFKRVFVYLSVKFYIFKSYFYRF